MKKGDKAVWVSPEVHKKLKAKSKKERIAIKYLIEKLIK